jgi:hypothetical protein
VLPDGFEYPVALPDSTDVPSAGSGATRPRDGLAVGGTGRVVAAASQIFVACYLLAPLPVCEISPRASLVALELFVMTAVDSPVTGSVGGVV